ncbi:hypothetical protein PCASD_11050 [Puccinia coronata f. sp. avenae]|uniref:Uncharacterized protein n=1 Tax=Puccinia coronata f. sp. avenae TaxID=200324 RepID=A0A2N5TC04_9BASI|nr:hypothetical protein PCASD_11050 [Puccinia coronata f. sp. avenae]
MSCHVQVAVFYNASQALPPLTGRTRLFEQCSNSRVRSVSGWDRSHQLGTDQADPFDRPARASVGPCLSNHRSNTAVRALLDQPCSTGQCRQLSYN